MKLQQRATLVRAGREIFLAWDFAVGFAGGSLAFGLCWVKAVRGGLVPVLLAEAAFGVAVTATVLAAMAIFATFYDAGYRRVLDLSPGGFRAALEPYGVVGAVAAASTVLGTLGAIAVPALGVLALALVVGVSSLLCVWSLAGSVSLISMTMFHATQRAALMRGADEAEGIRAKRLSERTRN